MGKVTWWVPRWSYARRLIRKNRGFLRTISVGRILLGSLIASVAICAVFKVLYPEVELLRWLWPLPFLVVAMFVWFGFNGIYLPVLIPPLIRVSDDEVRYSHGDEEGWIAAREDCTSFKIVVYSQSLRRLKFRHKEKRRSIGLAASVDVDQLRSLLPYPVKLFDSRQRFAYFQKVRSIARKVG